MAVRCWCMPSCCRLRIWWNVQKFDAVQVPVTSTAPSSARHYQNRRTRWTRQDKRQPVSARRAGVPGPVGTRDPQVATGAGAATRGTMQIRCPVRRSVLVHLDVPRSPLPALRWRGTGTDPGSRLLRAKISAAWASVVQHSNHQAQMLSQSLAFRAPLVRRQPRHAGRVSSCGRPGRLGLRRGLRRWNQPLPPWGLCSQPRRPKGTRFRSVTTGFTRPGVARARAALLMHLPA